MFNSATKRVARGAEFLDGIRPGWHRAIKPVDLNLSSNQDCVLGQVFGNYNSFMDWHFADAITARAVWMANLWTLRFGFNCFTTQRGHLLERLWLEQVALRLERDAEERCQRAAQRIRERGQRAAQEHLFLVRSKAVS